uniref:G8 domain-containing protein n=1 Tax=Echinococcus granulosus TaxID=6210 RepID=A0A068WYP5_ECHGR|nr:hypothetical protein EgrG_000334900 [Echinococcus granulosus]
MVSRSLLGLLVTRSGVSTLRSGNTNRTVADWSRGGGTDGTVPVTLTTFSGVVLWTKIGALWMEGGGALAAHDSIRFDGELTADTTTADPRHLSVQDNSSE